MISGIVVSWVREKTDQKCKLQKDSLVTEHMQMHSSSFLGVSNSLHCDFVLLNQSSPAVAPVHGPPFVSLEFMKKSSLDCEPGVFNVYFWIISLLSSLLVVEK